ncbi:7TM diverse intracellular signaling domain-containing protein [Flaviaesturariibacter amylovorans]|uniref:7TM-DISM receptor extracellular domain-containing protein n=1 Tax=Flaviaesturariibacter amylovorans TaxID=1084520 RepID=A0ABP8GIG5_9BACT
MMLRPLFCVFLSVVAMAASAQEITALRIFPDTAAGFETVCSQTARFTDLPGQVAAGRHWLMLVVGNTSAQSAPAYLSVRPQFRTELYAYDADKGRWSRTIAGLEVGASRQRTSHLRLQARPNGTDTFFVRVSSGPIRNGSVSMRTVLEPADRFEAKEQQRYWGWLITLAVMGAFFLYNLYIYFIFRDRTFLYFLLIVASGMTYITGINWFFSTLVKWRLVRATLTGDGIHFVDQNYLLADLSAVGVIVGFVLLARQYLQLPEKLPRLNRILSGATAAFVLLTVSGNLLTYCTKHFAHLWLSVAINIFILAIIALLLSAAVVLHRRQYRPAFYFLLANAFPLMVVALLAFRLALDSHLLSEEALPLPNIAILSHALTFAIALVARINLLKKELDQKHHEVYQLTCQNEQLAGRNANIVLEIERIQQLMAAEKDQNSQLQYQLEANQRELASNAVQLQQKQELLSGLQRQLSQLGSGGRKSEEALQQIRAALQNNGQLNSEWEKFKLHFEQVHPSFFTELLARFPDLTPYEIRLSAYLHLNLSAKEIALLLNIAPDSVYKAKTRLKKKLGEGRVDTTAT